MPDIFISYKYEERSFAGMLAERLTERGFDVWWDAALLAGERFEDEIRSILGASKVAVVLWSKLSVASDWVRAEAEIARKRGIVLPAIIDDVGIDQIPLLFQNMHTANLQGWTGEADHEGFAEIVGALKARVGTPAGPVLTPQQAEAKLAEGATEAELWAEISQNREQSAEEYRRYLERYGTNARFSELAILRIKKLENVDREKRWSWSQIGALIAGVGTLLAGVVALAQFVQANPSLLSSISGLSLGEWGISEEQKQAATQCDAWTRRPDVDSVTGLPPLAPDDIAACETAQKAYASTGRYDGHLALLRLAQGPSQGAASVKLANDGTDRKLPLAIYTQAIMYEQGYELQMNLQRAADLYREAADMGLVQAQARLCKMFLDNRQGWYLQVSNPVDFCQPAADAGDAVAQHALGLAYETGQWSLPISLRRAADLYQRSAAQGNSTGQWRLGILYRDGRGVARDLDKALDLFEAAMAQDDPAAIRLMGIMHELGLGVEQSYVRAGALYEAANEAGDTAARQLIGYTPNPYNFGYPRNYPEMEAIRSLAAMPGAIGQRMLAYDYYVGVTRQPDLIEAFRLYTSAAETGDPIAQASLGIFYERGIGVLPDTARAFELYKASAAQGEMHGQYQLGAAYEWGIGTPPDRDLAMQYYRLAANQGNRDAINRIAQSN